jgi:hypothetical protein
MAEILQPLDEILCQINPFAGPYNELINWNEIILINN